MGSQVCGDGISGRGCRYALEKWKWSCSVMSDSLWPRGLESTRLLCPWNFPGKNTGVGWHFLLQGIFLTQGSNPGLPHCRQMLYPLSHQGSCCALDQRLKILQSLRGRNLSRQVWLSGISLLMGWSGGTQIPRLSQHPGWTLWSEVQHSCFPNRRGLSGNHSPFDRFSVGGGNLKSKRA